MTSHELTIQQSVEGDFRQHDGVMTVMMKLPAQGFAKALKRYDRGGLWWRGAPHTTKRSMINLCVYGVPPGHVYKGWREEEADPHRARPKGGFLLLVGVGFPLS